MRHRDADVPAPSAHIERTVDRYEDMIIEATEGEGDGRKKESSLFINVPSLQLTGLFAMVNRIPVDLT